MRTPGSSNRISTVPSAASPSVVATRVSNVTSPDAVRTVIPSTSRSSCGTVYAATSAMPASIACWAVRGRPRTLGRPRASVREPPFDPTVQVDVRGRGAQDVDREERPGLRARCHGRERGRQHHQQAGAARLGRHGPDPRQHRDLGAGDALGQADPVLPERPGRVELQDDDRAGALGLREPVLQVAEEWAVDRPVDLDHAHLRRRLRAGGAARRHGEEQAGDQRNQEARTAVRLHGRRHRTEQKQEDRAYPGGHPMSVDTGRRPGPSPGGAPRPRPPPAGTFETASRSSRSRRCC